MFAVRLLLAALLCGGATRANATQKPPAQLAERSKGIRVTRSQNCYCSLTPR